MRGAQGMAKGWTCCEVVLVTEEGTRPPRVGWLIDPPKIPSLCMVSIQEKPPLPRKKKLWERGHSNPCTPKGSAALGSRDVEELLLGWLESIG